MADTMNYELSFDPQTSANSILKALAVITRVKEPSYFMESEDTLTAGLRDLDPQTIRKIHDVYFPTVYRYARYRVGDESVAEDLTSETFIRLLEAIHAGKGPNTSLRGWLMGTISNLVNDYYRRVYSQTDEPLHDGLRATHGDPVSLSDQRISQELLRKGLSRLTQDQQHVLALRFGNGCSLAETAEILGKKPNAVKQLQFRALVALRKQIEAEI
jgi:RNA polymerase sigma-70 factor (ECF subfamily)